MDARYEKWHELAIEDLGFELEELAGNPLDYFAREGARMILTVALNAEITDFLGRGRYERKADAVKGSRNGGRERTLKCGSGELELKVPRVRDTEIAFESRILKRWQRKSEALLDVIPLLYLEGLSTRDFKRALKPLLGESGLTRSSISRANKELYAQFQAWRERDLSEEDIMYLFLDGYRLGVVKGRSEKEAILVAHGVRRDGSRTLLGVFHGGRESTDSWKTVLHDLIDRGLKMPDLVISDGNAGLIRAVRDVWPELPRQRCVKHRSENVLGRIPKKRRDEVKKLLDRVFYANSEEEALVAAEAFSDRYRDEFPVACEVLGTDLADCLTYFRFPPRHHKRIRTSNVIERAFKEVRRRTNVAGRYPTPMSALVVVWGCIEEERLKWRGLHMDAEHERRVAAAVLDLRQRPIEVRGFKWLKAA